MSSDQPSPEEEYFFKKNQELIQKQRTDLDAKRQAQQTKAEKELHWMKCPKCAGQMEEVNLSSIMVDKCLSCKGIYFDNGELELLLGAQETDGFWNAFKKKLF